MRGWFACLVIFCAATSALSTATPQSAARSGHLTVQRFLAFGDSLTEGLATPHDVTRDAPSRPWSYPTKLQALLAASFPDDKPVVTNGGSGGESMGDAPPRLTRLLQSTHADVVLLMDGEVDLDLPRDVPIALGRLRKLIEAAEAAGARVVIATLPPPRAGAPRAKSRDVIQAYNAGIRQIATEEQMTLVDINAAVPVALVAPDGLHLTEQANARVAEAFFRAITSLNSRVRTRDPSTPARMVNTSRR